MSYSKEQRNSKLRMLLFPYKLISSVCKLYFNDFMKPEFQRFVKVFKSTKKKKNSMQKRKMYKTF